MRRTARVRSLAKINLDLRVLHRTEGFHELRTVFQTISLADSIEIQYEKARRTELTLDDPAAIPENLILRAARAVLEQLPIHARVHFRLTKRIPLGGGLGGGSSNAAAVLLALPILAGRTLENAHEIAAELGSDVPFFLHGGTALGLGRGTELYPLADLAPEPLLLIFPPFQVPTGPAYAALGRGLTFTGSSRSINSFQTFVRALNATRSAGAASAFSANDFETVVSRQHPQLKSIQVRLSKLGAAGVRMTGSGSTVIAIFRSGEDRERARRVLERDRLFKGCRALPAAIVNRRGFERLWRHQLREHLVPEKNLWPLQSRYGR